MPQKDAYSRRQYVAAIGASAFAGLAGCSGGGDGSSDGSAGNDSSGQGADNPSTTSSNDGSSDFPSEDIRVIVPHSAGGGTDRVSRRMADLAGDHMDASFFVNNVTGGSGAVGMQEGANAESDGHTVTATTVEISIYEHLGRAELTPDDFAPVIQTSGEPAAIAVHQDSEFTTLDSFLQYAKDNPGEISISNSGTGAIWHLSAAGMANAAEIEVSHIPYDGAAPATQAAISGETSAVCASSAEIATQVEDGPLEAVAVMSEEPVDILPDTPTLLDADIDFSITAWQGLSVPAGTPEEVVNTLYDGFSSTYESDEFQQFMDDNGFRTVDRGPEEFKQFMESEYEKFGEFVPDLDLN